MIKLMVDQGQSLLFDQNQGSDTTNSESEWMTRVQCVCLQLLYFLSYTIIEWEFIGHVENVGNNVSQSQILSESIQLCFKFG